MADGSRPSVPIAFGAGATETEEGRLFYQNRLALFGGWVFLISGGFLLVGFVLRAAVGAAAEPANWFHAAATLVAGVVWLAGRSLRLSFPTAQAVDAAGSFLICSSFAAMAAVFAVSAPIVPAAPMHALLVGLLACSYVLISRAVAVPSTPGRTVGISSASMAPMVVASAYVFGGPGGGLPAMAGFIDVMSWSVAAVAMAAVASRVIFGLRAEVSKIRQLGQYTLERKIGEGGMGVVYRARHALLRRPTAIKLLPPDRAGDDNLARFEREVQLTAQLSHPSTVAIFDFGRTRDGVFYYAMEYLDGIDLERLVQEDGPQPPGRVVHLLHQVCGALAEAHAVGLIHRDIKPANIILCERGGLLDVAKVVDFGLVKRIDPAGAQATLAVTSAHVLLGTPLYMAPEAISGADVDGRSDLYAVGAVAYFLLTGTPVFQAATVLEVFAHHLHSEPEPPSRRAGRTFPSDLERVILKCLAKSPADRFAGAAALQRALASCADTTPWRPDQSAEWWAALRRLHATEAGEPPTAATGAETAVIDLADRVAHPAKGALRSASGARI
jgi:serine/threonine-protein kinase